MTLMYRPTRVDEARLDEVKEEISEIMQAGGFDVDDDERADIAFMVAEWLNAAGMISPGPARKPLDDEERLDAAIDAVARDAAFNQLWTPGWEDYPEVMEGDWARIEDRMNALLEDGKPGYDDYEEGYALLEDRCKKYAEED